MESTQWKPSPEDYLDALLGQNPWSRDGKIPKVFQYPIKRPLAEQMWQTIVKDPWRYQIVIGPRRVGKTVSMYQTIQQLIDYGIPSNRLWFMRMDHPLFQHYPLGGWVKSLLNQQNPTTDKPLYLFVDEINYAKEWDTWLKTFYDEKWPVQVVATSSSSAALRQESGIGRWSFQYLNPCNFGEYLKLVGQDNPLEDRLDSHELRTNILKVCSLKYSTANLHSLCTVYSLIGGFPELFLDNLDQDDVDSSILRSQQTLRSEAIQRVTGMDLPQVFNIRQPLSLERLLYALASQMCNLISSRNLGSTLELNHQTVAEYIGYLEKAYLIFTMPAYSGSETNIQRRGRKVYFVDGAVRNAALQRGIRPASDPVELGALVENLVASHLFALALQNDIRLFHWRDRKSEVDFIYDDPAAPLAFEVTSSKDHSLKGLQSLQEQYPKFKGNCYLISRSPQCHAPDKDPQGIGRLPLETFLLTSCETFRHAMSRRLGVNR